MRGSCAVTETVAVCRPGPRPVVRQIVLGVSGSATSTVAVAWQSMTPGSPPSICSAQRSRRNRPTHHDLSPTLIRRGPRHERERSTDEGEHRPVTDIDRPRARHGASVGIAADVVADRPAGSHQAQVRRTDRRDRLGKRGRAGKAEANRRRRAHQRRAKQTHWQSSGRGKRPQAAQTRRSYTVRAVLELTLGGPLPFLE